MEDFRDSTRDSSRSASESSRDTDDSVRGTRRDASETYRDSRNDRNEYRNDSRDSTSGAYHDSRDSTSGTSSGTYRDSRDNIGESSRDQRSGSAAYDRNERNDYSDSRSDYRDSRDSDDSRSDFRSTTTTSRDSRSSANFRVDNVRSADIGLWFDRSSNQGLVIADIASQGAISRLGFREGDQIISVNGRRVSRETDFVQTLFNDQWRNDRVEVVVTRYGRQQLILVEPSVFVQEYTTVQTGDPLESYGIVLDDRYPDFIVVWRVIPRSPAFYAGIRSGDVIVNFNGQRVGNQSAFVRMMQQVDTGSVALDVNRNRMLRRLELDVPRGGVARASAQTSLRPGWDADSNARAQGGDYRSDSREGYRDDSYRSQDYRDQDNRSQDNRSQGYNNQNYDQNYQDQRGYSDDRHQSDAGVRAGASVDGYQGNAQAGYQSGYQGTTSGYQGGVQGGYQGTTGGYQGGVQGRNDGGGLFPRLRGR